MKTAPGLVSLLALCTPALAQLVQPARRVNVLPPPQGFSYNEPAIAASPSNPSHLVAAWRIQRVPAEADNWSYRVRYAISVNGGFTWSENELPVAAACTTLTSLYNATDPMAAASRATGDLFVGANVVMGTLAGPCLIRIAAGSPVLSGPPTPIDCGAFTNINNYTFLDRGSLAVGPIPGGSPFPSDERVYATYLLFAQGSHSCNGAQHWRIVGRRSADTAGLSWNAATPDARFDIRRPGGGPCDETGTAPVSAVVPSGPFAGRLIVAFNPMTNDIPVAVIDSDSGGYPPIPGAPAWNNPQLLDRIGTGQTITLHGDDDVPGLFEVREPGPSIAIDPTNPGTVYVAFAGMLAATPGNVDIFVARGTIGLTGALTFDPANILHISGAVIEDFADTDEIMPYMTVDPFGGVNLVWYSVRDTGPGSPPAIRPRYARIANFSVPLAAPLLVHDLGPEFTPDTPPHSATNQFIGHYQMITAAGCMVYPIYVSTHEGAWNVYVNRIVLCRADANHDGEVGGDDPDAFAAAYIAGDPRADVNQDGAVTATDVSDFIADYACGGCPN